VRAYNLGIALTPLLELSPHAGMVVLRPLRGPGSRHLPLSRPPHSVSMHASVAHMEEAGIFKVEANGQESCEIPPNSSFVLVRVPIRITGEGERSEALFYYSIGSFRGRDVTLPLRAGTETTLRFRVPLELFRSREHLTITIVARTHAGDERTLWLKRWEVAWQGKAPGLEPMAE
jgi:hypothetical protein